VRLDLEDEMLCRQITPFVNLTAVVIFNAPQSGLGPVVQSAASLTADQKEWGSITVTRAKKQSEAFYLSILTYKGSNKVGKWKSCHQEREIEHFGMTMAKP
jgi:hypothetical protein